MVKKWEEYSDKELADLANQGLQGQGASVEMMARLKETIKEASRSANRLSIIGIVLAFVIGILTLVLAFKK